MFIERIVGETESSIRPFDGEAHSCPFVQAWSSSMSKCRARTPHGLGSHEYRLEISTCSSSAIQQVNSSKKNFCEGVNQVSPYEAALSTYNVTALIENFTE